MADDLLRQRLAGYAAHGEEASAPPPSAVIRRRSRRLRGRRLLAVAVAALVVVTGVQAIGRIATRQVPTLRPAGPPSRFVADAAQGLVVVSTATGQVERVLAPPLTPDTSLGTLGSPYDPVVSGDGSTVWYGGDCTGERGMVYQRPVDGGPPAKVAEGSGFDLSLSADGSTLAWVDRRCTDELQERVTVHDLDRGTQRHWLIPASVRVSALAVSPDGHRLAMVTGAVDRSPARLRLLDLGREGSVLDGRVLAPGGDCQPLDAIYRPGSGQLAVAERCPGASPDRLQLRYLDPANGAPIGRPQVLVRGDSVVRGLDFDAAGDHLVYTLVSADQPYVTWQDDQGRPTRIGEGYRNPTW
jgi:hypothetical protein